MRELTKLSLVLNSSGDLHDLTVYRKSKLASISSQDTNKITTLSFPEKQSVQTKQSGEDNSCSPPCSGPTLKHFQTQQSFEKRFVYSLVFSSLMSPKWDKQQFQEPRNNTFMIQWYKFTDCGNSRKFYLKCFVAVCHALLLRDLRISEVSKVNIIKSIKHNNQNEGKWWKLVVNK